MTPISSAAQGYQLAKQALAPGAPASTSAKPAGAIGPAKGLQDFAKVFETVETTTANMVSGTGDAQSVVEAMAHAEMALETAVTIRNRVVEAYQELLRMPV